MSKSRRLTGGCQCGAVRYSVSKVIAPGVHFCHCRMCQKALGNVFASLAPVLLENLIWTRGKPKIFRSSTAAERGFCPKCGTPLTFFYRGGKHLNVTIGSLDNPGAVKPKIHYGTEARLKWLRLDDGLPQEDTDMKALKRRFPGYKSHQHPDHDTRRRR